MKGSVSFIRLVVMRLFSYFRVLEASTSIFCCRRGSFALERTSVLSTFDARR